MIGRTLSHYKVLSEISRGGMGVVYRAVDVKLDREIALKVLPPELVADPERKRRFIQEAKAAAKLEHPHIGVVHEIDEVEDTTFIVMELIQGEKLRDTIAKGPLPLRRSLEIATDIAEGLAKAHDRGIVHRDLKPANVMVTDDGHTKIIDFGLAKLVEPLAGEGSDIETLTRGETDPGKVMGTVSYMSPEQARGQTIDHRSDIFSFGIVLHEMLTGELPFRGPSAPETLSAIINSPTPELEIPAHKEMAPELQRVMDKCLAKEPEERYQGIKDLIVDLRAVRRRLESGTVTPATTKRGAGFWVAAAAAFLAAVVAGWLILWSPSKTEEAVSPGVDDRPSLTVLLFDNINEDPSIEWLRRGLTEMLVTDLSQSPNLRVLSTEQLYQILRDMNKLDERIISLDVIQDVAERANTQTVIHGSFMKAGENIRIDLRIQDASSGEILSTEKVEGVGESSIFSMVDDLTLKLKTEFIVPATSTHHYKIENVTTSSVEAFRYYVEGATLVDVGKNEEAVPLLEKALEIDSRFAQARMELSSALFNQRHFNKAEKVRRLAAEHAQTLPPRERLYIQGSYYRMRQETFDRAIETLENLLEIHPEHPGALNNLALAYRQFESYDEAIRRYEEFRRRQYTFHAAYNNLADCYARIDEFEKGYQVLQDYVEQHPDVWRAHYNLGAYLTRWGKTVEGLQVIDKATTLAGGNLRLQEGMWEAFVLLEEWEQASDAANKMTGSNNPAVKLNGFRRLAVAQLYQGRSEETLSSLEKALIAYGEPDQNTAWTHNTVACILLEQGQADTAMERTLIAQSEAKGKPGEWKGLFLTALAQAELGQWEGAKETAAVLKRKAEALPTEKEKRRYHHLMGELALMRGEMDKALEELERAESMLPPRGFHLRAHHVPIWYSLASAHTEAGDSDKAAEWFRRVAESGAEHVWFPIPYVRSFYFLGKIHENLGNMEKAREYYRRFYEYWKDGDMDRERVEEARSKIKK